MGELAKMQPWEMAHKDKFCSGNPSPALSGWHSPGQRAPFWAQDACMSAPWWHGTASPILLISQPQVKSLPGPFAFPHCGISPSLARALPPSQVPLLCSREASRP